MKHKPIIVMILLLMFIITQFIGLYVIFHYANPTNELPLGMGYPQTPQTCDINSISDLFSCTQYLVTIIFAFIIAVTLFLFLTKIKAEFIIRLWFFLVVAIALVISFLAIPGITSLAVAGIAALFFSFMKVFRRNLWFHNFTELLVYPGIAAVFIPILNVYTVLILLVLISIYDMWAVWHSKIMIKMAKYQINKVRAFSGFFVPYMSKNVRLQLQKMKSSKTKSGKSNLKNKGIKVNVAILGGGDVVFPIITAGVFLLASPSIVVGLFYALSIIIGAAAGLLYLFIRSEKKKFYPAMPFITTGIFAGLLVAWLISMI
ncbi:MAG: presenilin family intramembrane aspartyl protease [Candidatus Pacearchaeota archaeon]